MFRNYFVSLFVAVFAVGSAFAQNLGSLASEEVSKTYQWDDISIFRINKESAKAFFVLCDSLESARQPICVDAVGKIYNSKPYTLLNSDWHFFFIPTEKDVKPDFFLPNCDVSNWDIVNLPDTWQTRGYDKISYMNIYPEYVCDYSGKNFPEFADIDSDNPSIGVLKPRIPDLHRQSAVYRKEISIDDFSDNKVYIFRIGAVKSGVKIFVNGKFAGYSEDSFTPAEFDISKFLKKGKNLVALQVFKYTTGSYLEVQDMPHVMGILRNVVLIERPKTRIADIVADARIDGGKFTFTSKIFAKSNQKNLPENLSAELVFTDSKGKILKTISSEIPAKSAVADLNLNFSAGEVAAWSPDKPNLYQAIYQLKQNGKVLETAKIDVGFRTFFIDEKLRLIWNGVSIKIKGVNRHDYAPQKGSAVDFETLKNDILLVKTLNINAIRTSHYPNPEEFYMLCNRLGVLVLDENNLETHALWNHVPGNSGTYDAVSCDRITNMLMRDRNQPCVFGWSLGNENGREYTKAHQKMEQIVKELAPEPKLVHCEPATYSQGNTSSFHSPMYGSVFALDSYLSKPRKKPFMFCEYCFAVGNGIGNIYDVWQKMRSEPSLLGGFLWDFADRTLLFPVDKNNTSEKFLADGRDFGTCRNAGIWCASGIVDAYRNWYPKTFEVQKVYQDIQMQSASSDNLTLKISNEFDSTDLSELSGVLSIYCNGDKLLSKPISLSLGAGESKEFKIDLPNFDSKRAGEYFYELAFVKDSGLFKNVSSKRFLIKKVAANREIAPKGKVSISEANEKIEVKSGDMILMFDKKNALLESVSISGGQKIIAPFEFDYSCAWLDNFGQAKREFIANGMDSLTRLKPAVKVEKISPSAVRIFLSAGYSNEMNNGFMVEQAYTILGGGVCEVSTKITKLNDTPAKLYLARVGLKTLMPAEQAQTVKYLGFGPNANYNDKIQAANFGKWQYKVSGDLLAYAKPQDCGNREGVALFEIFGGQGKPLVIVSEEKALSYSLLPNTQEEILKAKHYKDLPKSEVCELRIAPLVSGVGNGALAVSTLDKYRPYFEGSVEFKFAMFAADSNKSLDDFYSVKFADKYSYNFPHEEKNRVDARFGRKMEGDWISKDAKMEYSSLSKEYHHQGDNPLLCEDKNFAFHTNRDEPLQYAIVDLGSVCELSGIILYNRKDAQSNRTNNMYCLISEDGKNWREIWNTNTAKPLWKIFCADGTRARFVKLELRKKEYFHLSGIKIIGKKK